jgi:ABC-type branched-subunit amino acid transport system substrate-binding protein
VNRTGVRTAAVFAALTLALAAGCSTKGDDDDKDTGNAPTGGAGGKVKTGPGVSDTNITLGSLTDLSGPYAPLGKSIVNAQQLWADEVNAEGGICGRKIQLTVKDHGYDVQKASAAYTEIQPNVVGFPQVIGSHIATALLENFKQDKTLAFPFAWAANLLGKPEVQVVGTTYDIDMIIAMEFLTRTVQLKPGDKVGHIYFEGEFGENALMGSKYAASQSGLQIVEQKIKATDTQMAAQVAALRQAGVKAILVSGGPTQTGSTVGIAAVSGLNVPVLTSSVGFHPQILQSPAGAAAEKSLFMVSAIPAVGTQEIPGVKKMVDAYKVKYPQSPVDQGVLSGYSSAKIFGETLKAACTAGDLSREGVLAAHRKAKSGDLGLGMKADFTDVNKPSTYESYILKVDKNAAGGLTQVEPAHEVPGVRTYTLPKG